MKELDILLTRYLDECYCTASPEEQKAFGSLLETQDPQLFAYCLGQERPPAHLAVLIARITATPATERS